MGTWNTTCMISKLPILEHEECYGVLVTPTGKLQGTSYPDGKYRPISPVMYGTYSGAGTFENIRNLTEEIMDEILENLRDQYGRKYFSFDNLMDSFPNGGTKTYGTYSALGTGDVYLVFIKKSVYEHLIAAMSDTVEKVKIAQKNYRYNEDFRNESILREEFIFSWSDSSLCHPINHKLVKAGADYSGVGAINKFMDAMRLQWITPSGEGSTRGIDDQMQIDFYKMVHDEAKQMFAEYNSDEL